MAILEDLLVRLGFKVEGEGLSRADELLEGMNHKLELLAGMEIARGLYELVEHFSQFAVSLEQASYQAGVTTEEFQKLVYAGSQFSVSQDQIQMALAKMSRLLQNARDGSKGAVEQFNKLGISQEQLSSFTNAEDAFYAVQDALAKIPDSFRRVAATQAIFGRGAYAMTKFVAAGSAATRGFGKEAVSMGAVVREEGIEGLAKFEEAMSALNLTVKATFMSIAGAFAPAIKATVKELQHFIGAHRELIAQNVTVWSRRIAFALGFVTELFRIITTAVVDFIEAHPKLIRFVLKTAAVLLGMSIAGSVLKGVLGLVSGAFAIVSAAVGLLGGELTLVLTGVTLLVLGFKALWDMAHGKSFEDTALGEGLVWLKDYAKQAGEAFKELTGYKTGIDISAASPDELMSPLSNRSLSDKHATSAWDDAMNGLAMANNGMSVINRSAVPMGGSTPGLSPMLLRPSGNSAQNINVTAPVSITVNGTADHKQLKAQMEKAADDVFKSLARKTQRDLSPAEHR